MIDVEIFFKVCNSINAFIDYLVHCESTKCLCSLKFDLPAVCLCLCSWVKSSIYGKTCTRLGYY